MALASTTATNSAIQGIFPTSTNFWLAVHTASPGTTGANEMAGQTRGVFTVGAASGGAVSNLAIITVATPGSSAATHVGAWDAVSAGNYKMGAALTSNVTATSITFAVGAVSFTAS
ncbi:MAG TPA: hypothetical protein VFE69_06390 [Ilumatobacteraceae bacterium]|nr:hypothetical protein [Ilumatobacteraceae bacterium]